MATETGLGAEIGVSQPTILLGDDDLALAAGLSEVLGSYGFACDHAGDWPTLRGRLQTTSYDLLILEMRLGRVDLVHRFAEIASDTAAPIIFLTCQELETDRILALEKGAAGVLRKPISGREIVARVRAQLRRSAAPTRPPELQLTWRISCGQLGFSALSASLAHSGGY